MNHRLALLLLAITAGAGAQLPPAAKPAPVAHPAPPASPAAATAAGARAAAPPPASFPPPPTATGTAGQTAPVQQSNYGKDSYPAQQAAGAAPADPNGIAPLPPLSPPPGVAQEATVSPFTPDEIVRMRKQFDATRKAKAYRPQRTVPRISSITVDLSPGGALPIARMLPGEMSTLVFLDASGAPWPLAAAPRVSDARYFDVEWLKGTATVVISALSPYEDGNLSVQLQGFALPVVVKLATGEPGSKSATRIVDYRLDLRIPGRAPGTPAGVLSADRIALYDETMQQFLDGLPPAAAKPVKVSGANAGRTKVWALNGALFVRTSLDMQTAFDQSMASGDGTRVYRIAPTPLVTLADGPRALTLQLDID